MRRSLIFFLESYLGRILCWLADLHHAVYRRLPFTTHKHSNTKKVVFLKLIEQGALVLHLPTFEKAVRLYGKENVFICSFASNASLLCELQVFETKNIILINEQSLFQFVKNIYSFSRFIRKNKIDTLIDLEFFSRSSAVISYWSGAGKRIGFHRFQGSETYRGNLLTLPVVYNPYLSVGDSSMVLLKVCEQSLSVLPALDMDIDQTPATVCFTPTAAEVSRINNLLQPAAEPEQLKIIINPNLNDPLPLRQWPEEYYAALIQKCQRAFPHCLFIFTGREDEHALTDAFIQTHNIGGALNYCGKTSIRELLTLYSCCDLLLTSDSGPGHFAALTKIPTLVLFGPETPALYGPRAKNVDIIYAAIACSPCFNAYNNRTSACTNNLCMKKISPELVFQRLQQLLKKDTAN